MTFNPEQYDNKFIGDLVSFVAGDKFQSMFENFFLNHALEFDYEEEHKLHYYELYQKFHDMFERQLDIFCDSVGMSQTEFMKRCRDATTHDAKAKHYMDILLSSVEYDTFVKLMRLMRPVAQQRLLASESEAKSSEAKFDSPSKATAKEVPAEGVDSPSRTAESKSDERNDESKAEKGTK